jgi:hypothetical protein
MILEQLAAALHNLMTLSEQQAGREGAVRAEMLYDRGQATAYRVAWRLVQDQVERLPVTR